MRIGIKALEFLRMKESVSKIHKLKANSFEIGEKDFADDKS